MLMLRSCALVVLVAMPAFAAAPPAGRRDLYGDPLPEGAVTRMGTVRWYAGLRLIRRIAYVPGGKLLATAGTSSLSLWDLRTGRLVRKILDTSSSCPSPFCAGFTFTPDGKRLLSADGFTADGKGPALLCWDVCSGKIIAQSPSLGDIPHRFAIRGDGRMTACTTRIGDIVLWDPTSQSLRYLERGKGMGDYGGLTFTTDGKYLLVLNDKQPLTIRQIDIASGRTVKNVSFGSGYCMAIDATKGTIATRKASELHLYDSDTGKLRQLPLKDKVYPALSFSPDGRTLLGWDRRAEKAWLWDVATGRLLRRLHLDRLKGIDEHSPLLLSDD